MITSLKPVLACMAVGLLLGGCNRSASTGDTVVATADLQPGPVAGQAWEPVSRPASRQTGGLADQLPDDSPAAGPGGSVLPQKASFPEGSLSARQAPVPDVILAAEMAASDQAVARQHASMPVPGGPAAQINARMPRQPSPTALQQSKADPQNGH